MQSYAKFVVVVVLLFYVHGKHLRSCRDGHFILFFDGKQWHYVASDLGLHCLPMTLLQVSQ